MIVMPSSLEEYFESLAIVTEPIENNGLGLSISDFNELMPWHLDILLGFKVECRTKETQTS